MEKDFEMSHTVLFSEWVENLQWEDIPGKIVQQTKRCFLDSIGCMVGGARSKPGRISAKLASDWGGNPEATIIGGIQPVAARHAAFANATMANALDFDDTLQGHPGSTTFPTVMAAAEKWHSSGKEMLMAAIVGYELSVRAMGLMQPMIPRYRAMWDLGTLQAYGAAAAAAKLAGLDFKGIANAIGLITGTTVVPLPRKERYEGEGRSMLKSAYGWVADSCIVASELTLAGFSGPGHALDDNMGFWEVQPSDKLGLKNLSDQLGRKWAIMDVAFKPFMACRFIHPVLQGIEELLLRTKIEGKEINKVEIGSFSLLADEHHSIYRPISGTDAQFSVPFTVAAMLSAGRLSPETYSEDTLFDPEVLELADRVHVTKMDEFEVAFPERLGARVRLELRDGRVEEIVIKNPKGAPDQPLTDDELILKFQNLTQPLIDENRIQKIRSLIENFEDLVEINTFTRLLGGL